jgi:hypothetical protein
MQTFVACGKLTPTWDEPRATQGVHDHDWTYCSR